MRYLFLLLATTLTAAEPFSVKVSGNPTGQPVILIPGLSSSGDVWNDTVEHFKHRYQCHTVTLAGFAGQPRFGDGPFLESVRDSLIRYIETNKIEKPLLIGHSLGGHMALWIASLRPELPGPLIIVDSLPYLGGLMNQDPAALRKQAEAMRRIIASQSSSQYGEYISNSGMLNSLVGDKGLPQVTRWSLQSDPVAIGNAMYDLYTTDLRQALARIQSKVLVLVSWMSYKQVSTRENALQLVEAQYEKLPNKSFRISDTAKHFIMLDDPEWYLLQLDTFLQ